MQKRKRGVHATVATGAGKPPYPLGRNTSEVVDVLRRKARCEPPPRLESLCEGLPSDLVRLVHRMLDYDPQVRPQAADVAEKLGALIQALPPAADEDALTHDS